MKSPKGRDCITSRQPVPLPDYPLRGKGFLVHYQLLLALICGNCPSSTRLAPLEEARLYPVDDLPAGAGGQGGVVACC